MTKEIFLSILNSSIIYYPILTKIIPILLKTNNSNKITTINSPIIFSMNKTYSWIIKICTVRCTDYDIYINRYIII